MLEKESRVGISHVVAREYLINKNFRQIRKHRKTTMIKIGILETARS